MKTFRILLLLSVAVILLEGVYFAGAQFPVFFRPRFMRRRFDFPGNTGGHRHPERESDYDFRERNRQYGYAAILG